MSPETIVAEFADLLNTEGPSSPAVQEFLLLHHEGETGRLLKTALRVYALFHKKKAQEALLALQDYFVCPRAR